MATEKILGRENESTNDISAVSVLYVTRFQAAINGTAQEIKFQMMYPDTLSLVLYADNGGVPDARLYVDHPTSNGGGSYPFWVTHTMTSEVEIVAGNYYWLGSGGNSWRKYKNGVGVSKYKSWDYGTAPPSPAGTGFSDITIELTMELWGTASAGGWANIAKLKGATATDLAKVNGAAVADIAKLLGVAV